MHDQPTEAQLDNWRTALSPSSVRVSPMFHGILAFILGVKGWSKPDIWSMAATSDGFLIGYPIDEEGEVLHSQMLGDTTSLYRNLRGVGELCLENKDDIEVLVEYTKTRLGVKPEWTLANREPLWYPA